jgi:hypothetical protein
MNTIDPSFFQSAIKEIEEKSCDKQTGSENKKVLIDPEML